MAIITQTSPDLFSLQDYTFEDYDIVPNFEVTSLFQPEEDLVEYFIYDANNNLLHSEYRSNSYSFTQDPSITNLGGYSTINIDPKKDLSDNGFDVGQYNIVYNFFEPQLGSNSDLRFYLKEISSDRTELRLSSNNLTVSSENFTSFITKLQGEDYFNEFYLNFGNNQISIAVNALQEGEDILIKLYEPLPSNFSLKNTCWVTIKIADPIAYNVSFLTEVDSSPQVPFLKGPNTNIQIKGEINNSTDLKSYEELISSNLTSSYQQINNLLNQQGIDINIDHTDYSNFIYFSSAEQRLLNFYEKVSLIESSSNQLNSIDNQITGSTSSSYYVSGSKASLQNIIDNTIENFDSYEYFLYFDSGSKSWPKSNSTYPYNLYSTGSSQVLNWLGSSNESSVYYGGQALSASRFDNDNVNSLTNLIPEYITDDPQNSGYQLFIEMIGQHFDSIWVYIKDITNKFNADNRLNYGISKDLVAQAVRDFGLKIYQNQFSQEDLFTAFLGITPSGSLLPSTGSEVIETYVTASSDVTPLDDVNKAIYKRLYHNIPYLLNKKGTIQGIKALIASYGIPNTILRVSEFGGKDRDNSNDYDYWYPIYNQALEVSGSSFFTNSQLNSAWGGDNNRPGAIELRIKPGLPPTSSLNQRIFNSSTGMVLTLAYDGGLQDSGSYSGSIKDNYQQYGTLGFIPDNGSPATSASVYLPFFDDGWWSILLNTEDNVTELISKNKLYIGDDASQIGFQASASISSSTYWTNASSYSFPGTLLSSYQAFTGSLQELRYWAKPLSQSVFDVHVMNPESIEGNSINSSYNELAFRLPLGGELYTNSGSIHPKVAGAWETTSSFTSISTAAFTTTNFVPNTEYILVDQPAVGIKNRITDKVKIGTQTLPSGSEQVLSQYRSIEQTPPISQSFTANVNLLEVAFSPQNEINDDIISQIGYFNIGDYIGDRRYATSNNDRYEDLYKLASEYFEKYTRNYDVFDYIRLIKYFDNSLFKMIKDFVPAKTSLQSGVVVKQHLLERNRIPEFQLSYEQNDYSGSISVGSFSGGAAGSVNKYNELAGTVPDFTQSFSQSLDTIAGTFNVTHSTQDEFYNGEYSGSALTVTTQSLNPECWVYLHDVPDSTAHPAAVFNTSASFVTEERFIDPANTPLKGSYTYFLVDGGNVTKIRVSKEQADNNELESLTTISTISSDVGSKTYNLDKLPVENSTDFLYTVLNPSIGAPTEVESSRMDHSFSLRGYTTGYQFKISGSGIKPYQIQDSSAYNGYWFYPFTAEHSQRPLVVTQNPYNYTSAEVWDQDLSTVIYHYFNDSLLDIAPGTAGPATPRNYYTGFDYQGGAGYAGQITMAMVSIIGDRVEVLWESDIAQWQDVGSDPAGDTFSDRWQKTTQASETSFISNYADIKNAKYLIGFITGSNIKAGNGSLVFSRDTHVSISQSQYSNEPNGTLDIIRETNSPSGFTNSDCDVLQGNANTDRVSNFYMDVDYSTNAAVAVNQDAILSNSAPKADVQDSNYTLARHINPRYDGSRSTSQQINEWSEGDTNTYGKSATVDSQKTYYAYFDFINGLSPELKGKSIAHIQFLVDERGTNIPPDSSSLALTQGTFKTDEYVFINLNDPTRFEVPMNQLNGKKQIIRGGYRVDALLYSDSGSSYVDEINFDTGSFSVTNYEFGTTRTNTYTSNYGTNTIYNWNSTTKSNTQWNLSTDKFTFGSDSDNKVRFQSRVSLSGGFGGSFEIFLKKNYVSGDPASSGTTLDSTGIITRGGFGPETFTLDSGYQNFNNGDEITVVIKNISYSNLGVNSNLTDFFSSTNEINPDGVVSTPYWSLDSTNTNWITASADLSNLYGSKQLDVIPYDGTTNQPEFDPIIQNFTTLVGDEVRFRGAEAYSYMIQDVLPPEVQEDGKLKLKLNANVPDSVTGSLDHFLLRRYVKDASYVILDADKPLGSTSPGIMRPEYVTDQLDRTLPDSSQDIIKSIT